MRIGDEVGVSVYKRTRNPATRAGVAKRQCKYAAGGRIEAGWKEQAVCRKRCARPTVSIKGLWGMTTRKPTNEISLGKGAPYKTKVKRGPIRPKKYKENEGPEK
jgi:hypothetical protein